MHGGGRDPGGGRPRRPEMPAGSWVPAPPPSAAPPPPPPRLPPAPPPPPGIPTSPTGRVPQWVLDQAVGRPVDPVPWRNWEAGPRRGRPGFLRRRRRRRGASTARGVLAVLVVLVLALGTAVLLGPRPWPWEGAPDTTWSADRGPASGPVVGDEWPTPGFEAAPSPLGSPPAVPEDGEYGFVAVQADGVTPVAYDPCRPVRWVLRPDGAPPGGADLVEEVMARTSAATGLQFVFDGTTDEVWQAARPAYQPDRYGDRWAPVLVGWATPAEVPELAGAVVGLGGSAAVSVGGPRVFVTGAVALDAEWAAGAARTSTGRDLLLDVVLHEIGHVVGLDHVDDPGELMHSELLAPGDSGRDGLGPGDRAGLAALGAGACEPAL